MPLTIEAQPAQVPLSALRRKLTRQDCQALAAAGLLEWERYELIDGELIRKVSKSADHVIVLQLLVHGLQAIFGWLFVRHESPVDLSAVLDVTNEPEPDAVVLVRSSLEYRPQNPGPGDVRLIAEIAVTTRDYDLGTKAALYARAGFEDYWVFDLPESRIVVHREPTPDGYRQIVAYGLDEPVSPLAAPEASIRLRDLLAR